MSDFTRFVTNKLSGEWSAGNVSGVLTDAIIEYLVSGDKWEGLDPLVRTRLLLAPLFMRKHDLEELRPALAKLAAAGAADKDEWVRAMAQSVGSFDGRLHSDRLLAGSRLVGRTAQGLQPLLDAADPRLFRPLEEVFMNQELLHKLRQQQGTAAGGDKQQAQAAAQQLQAAHAAPSAAPKQHHHFRPRPASEAPSQRQAGGGGAAAAAVPGRAASHAVSAAGSTQQAAPARPAAPAQRASALPPAPASATAKAGRLAAAGIDSMFMPRKPSLTRPAAGGGAGARTSTMQQARRAATLDVDAVRQLNEQRRAERERAEKAAREAAEAEARAKAEAKAAEKAAREAEKEAEQRRLAQQRAAEKAAREAAARQAKEAARVAKEEGKAAARAARAAAAVSKAAEEAKAGESAVKAAAKAAKEPRKRQAPGSGERPAKRPSTGEQGGSAGKRQPGAARPGSSQRPVLLSPEAATAALGDAALAAAADEAGMQLGDGGVQGNVDAMHDFLAAAYGQRYSSSDEEEPDV